MKKLVNIITDDDMYIPKKGTPGSAGYDCVAKSMEYLPEERCWVYDLGFKIQLPKGYFGDLRPRSSIYKAGPWYLANSAGVLDSDYQGDVKAIFKSSSDEWDCVSEPPYYEGERVCQLILTAYSDMELEKVDKFETKTKRGTGGHGSTGRKAKK